MKRMMLAAAIAAMVMAAAPAWAKAVFNGKVDIPAAGATDRTRLPANGALWCFFHAPAANTGTIYMGGATVTNASGAAVGYPIAKGGTLTLPALGNTNEVYFAADTAGDDVVYVCEGGN